MAKLPSLTVSFFLLNLILLGGISSATDTSSPGTPDFFKEMAETMSESIRKGMAGVLSRSERNQEDGQAEQSEDLIRPEVHFSTLRAQASGSGIPSPTMFVGGFSFMMMPMPEGQEVVDRIMEMLPNLPNSGGK